MSYSMVELGGVGLPNENELVTSMLHALYVISSIRVNI